MVQSHLLAQQVYDLLSLGDLDRGFPVLIQSFLFTLRSIKSFTASSFLFFAAAVQSAFPMLSSSSRISATQFNKTRSASSCPSYAAPPNAEMRPADRNLRSASLFNNSHKISIFPFRAAQLSGVPFLLLTESIFTLTQSKCTPGSSRRRTTST